MHSKIRAEVSDLLMNTLRFLRTYTSRKFLVRFLLYFCCLSIVLTGCGSKRYENTPQDSIYLQAKIDAESDAKHDVNLLAYFGAGVSAPLAAGMCALMTGCIADLHFGHRSARTFVHNCWNECCNGLQSIDSILYASPSTESAT